MVSCSAACVPPINCCAVAGCMSAAGSAAAPCYAVNGACEGRAQVAQLGCGPAAWGLPCRAARSHHLLWLHTPVSHAGWTAPAGRYRYMASLRRAAAAGWSANSHFCGGADGRGCGGKVCVLSFCCMAQFLATVPCAADAAASWLPCAGAMVHSHRCQLAPSLSRPL